jgi:ankyrin repeat protein
MTEFAEVIESADLPTIQAAIAANKSLVNEPLDEYGFTPLHRAVSLPERTFEIINLFIQNGADVNAATKGGDTALHFNIDLAYGSGGHGELPYKIARLLKDAGADTELTNHYGWTPLMRAALEGTTDEFKALLEIGAKFDVHYAEHSMPAFTRGRSLAEITMPRADKFSLLLEYGFKPDKSLLARGKESLAEAADPESKYSKNVQECMKMISRALVSERGDSYSRGGTASA